MNSKEEPLYEDSSSFLKPYEPLIYRPNPEVSFKEKNKGNASTKKNKISTKEVKVFDTYKKKFINPLSLLKHTKNKSNKNEREQLNQDKGFKDIFNQIKQNKLDKYKRFKEKKIFAKYLKKKQMNVLETIDLSAIDENDDVICIPTPGPQIINLDESDEEQKEEDSTEAVENFENVKVFTKPKNKSFSAPATTVHSNNSSRCASPSSIFSVDDFISQQEKTKLAQKTVLNDDDLIFTETVDSFVNRQNKCENIKKNLNECSMPPPTLQNKKIKCVLEPKTTKKNDFLVKGRCYRAVDVYDESESDVSIYAKGVNLKIQNLEKSKDVISNSLSSSSSMESIEIDLQKIKRLRKRRSSSNKSSDKKNTDDSEDEDEINENDTGISYISKGEAIEKVKKKRKLLHINSNTTGIKNGSSDNEFISKLNNIVHKNNLENHISNYAESTDNESDNESANVTARNIVEDVIKKCEPSKTKETVTNDSSVESVDVELSTEVSPDVSRDKYLQLKVPGQKTTTLLTETMLGDIFNEIEKLQKKSILNQEKKTEIDSIDTNLIDAESIVKANKAKTVNINGVMYYMIDLNSADHFEWPEEMFHFYNKSWGGESFTVTGIQQTMDRNANWSINSADRYPIYKKSVKLKCFNCCEFGHVSSKCPQPRKKRICHMCGKQGHFDSLCPNAICLKCGSRNRTFLKKCRKCMNNNQYCRICKISGHNSNYCPDKWRRYHSTVKPNTELNSNVIYNKNKYCCICSKRGHFAEQCREAQKFLDIRPSITEIMSHYPVIKNQSFSNLDKVPISYNLLYDPNISIKFNLSQNKEFCENGYYIRFLKFVGLMDEPIELNSNKIELETSKQKLINSILISKTFNSNDLGSTITLKEILNSENVVTGEYQFKSPNSVLDKINIDCDDKNISNVDDLAEKTNNSISSNKSDIHLIKNDQKNNPEKDLIIDSDSNYSFSEHFDVPKSTDSKKVPNEVAETENTKSFDLSKPQRISRPMGDLGDYIPLCDPIRVNAKIIKNNNIKEDLSNLDNRSYISLESSNDYNRSSDDFQMKAIKTFGISHNLRHNSESDLDESSYPDIPITGKIFLTKIYSDYLLSPTGNKFLIENSVKYNVQASIDWTSVGNVLVLEGLRSKLNKLHEIIVLALQSITMKNQNDLLENVRVPRKRSVLIDFLEEDLKRLERKVGVPYDLNKRLKLCEFNTTKKSLRRAQRIRSKLNMVLFGQAGLREGKIHLENLITQLKALKDNEHPVLITNDIRCNIEKSWKYIFSSFDHVDYNELISDYSNMQHRRTFKFPNISERIRYFKPTFEIQVKDDNLNISNEIRSQEESHNCNNEKFSKRMYPFKQESESEDSSNRKIPKLVSDVTDTNKGLLSSIQDTETTFNQESKQLQPICPTVAERIGCILNKIIEDNSLSENANIPSSMIASQFWSREAVQILKDMLKKHTWNIEIEKKIKILDNKGLNNLLSYHNYKDLHSIKNIL